MLSQQLQYPPGGGGPGSGCNDVGTGGCYSNFGYMLLGRIVEQVTGMSHVNYIRKSVLTPGLWVPSTEIFLGRTRNTNAREPLYVGIGTCTDVFDPEGDSVNCGYGSWHHESFVGHGNLVVSAAPLLVFTNNYQVNNGGTSGTPLTAGPASATAANHRGSIPGTSTIMQQRGDGINIVVLFNKREPSDNPHYASTMATSINSIITGFVNSGSFTWPTLCVDGFWVDFNSRQSFPVIVGSYDYPFANMGTALASTTHGTKLRFKPGRSNWTGTINKRMLLDAPFGRVTIGG